MRGMRSFTRSTISAAALLRIFLVEQEKVLRFPVVDDGHLSLVDAVGIRDDVAAFRLAEDRLQAHHRRTGDPGPAFFSLALDGLDHVTQHVACTDAGKLIDVADQQQVCAGWYGLEQVIRQQQVQHGCLVEDHDIGFERVFFVALKAEPFTRLELQQPVDRLGLAACRLSSDAWPHVLWAMPAGRVCRPPRPAE